MDTGFHYEDVPPQDWLDELHAFDIPRVWDIQLNKTQRTNLISRAKNQLGTWRKALQDQLKTIQRRYDKSNRDAMSKMLAPYKKLESLGNDLNSRLRDLEKRIQAGKAVPQGFAFGTRIFGDMESRRWHFGDREDEIRWDDFMDAERRYKSMGREYRNQSNSLKNIKLQLNEQKSELQKLSKQYKQRSGCAQIGVRLFIVLLTVIFCLIVGAAAFFEDSPLVSSISNEVFGSIMLILGVVGAIVAIILARRRTRSVSTLQQEITETRSSLKQLQQEGKRQKKLLFPTQQTFKEVTRNYQQLKASFE